MAFPMWPGKKDVREPAPTPKREFPEGIVEGEKSDQVPSRGQPPFPTPESPATEDAGLRELIQRLGQLGQLLDQANEQVTAYLLQRPKPAQEMSGVGALGARLDALCEKLLQAGDGGNRSVDQKLDALYGKLDQLAASGAGRSGGSGGTAPAGVSDAAVKSALRPVEEKLDQVESKLRAVFDKTAGLDSLREAFVPTLVQVRDALAERIGSGIQQLQQQLGALGPQFDARLRTIADQLRPPQPERGGGKQAVSGDWQQAILGNDLAENAALAFQRNQLLQGVLSGEPAASSLAGHLLVFRSSPAEKMPAVLKDVGEAFYRWQPRTSGKPNEMEKALVAWLMRTCDAAGISNTIELVHPGERFDSTRHSASERGVEITQVLGWIVLRDNGKVYTKASVAVK
jgi:hypothetical protein